MQLIVEKKYHLIISYLLTVYPWELLSSPFLMLLSLYRQKTWKPPFRNNGCKKSNISASKFCLSFFYYNHWKKHNSVKNHNDIGHFYWKITTIANPITILKHTIIILKYSISMRSNNFNWLTWLISNNKNDKVGQ